MDIKDIINSLVFCLSLYGLVYILRTIVELNKKFLQKVNFYWKELILPLLPLFLGGIIGFFDKTVPQIFSESDLSKILYGIVCGMFSGLVYRLAKKNISERISNFKNDVIKK